MERRAPVSSVCTTRSTAALGAMQVGESPCVQRLEHPVMHCTRSVFTAQIWRHAEITLVASNAHHVLTLHKALSLTQFI